MLSLACPADQVHLRSHSGPGSSRSSNQLRIQIDSGTLQDLGVGEVAAPTVSGGSQVRVRYAAGQSCPRSGRLRRAVAPEKTLARVQGGRSHSEVQRQVKGDGEREIEVLASGLPLHHGAQLDITLRSALTRCGNACDQADRVNGIVASSFR